MDVRFSGSNRSRTLLLALLLLRLLNPHITPIGKSLHWLKVNERIEYKLPSLTYKVLTTTQPNYTYLSSTSSQYPLLICCRPFSPANHLLLENHRSLVQICIISSLELTSRFIPSASPVLSRFTSSSTCQPISLISPLFSSITPLFHSVQAENVPFHLFNKSFSP